MSGVVPIVPTIPASLQIYNSYVEDPKWQRKFSIIWASFTAFAIVLALPHLLRAIRNGRAFNSVFGLWEDISGKRYAPVRTEEKVPQYHRRWRIASGVLRTLTSGLLWTLPGSEINVGQFMVIAGYLATVIVCIVKNAPLVTNPNRAGFLALAQLPVVFLFATKNSILSLLLGPGNGYEKLNYVHRWSGRGMFIGAAVHGGLWIRNHQEFGLPILGPQKETSGVAAFALLCIIVLTSLRPIRRMFYQLFFAIHILASVSFFVTICYHTIYASPWIFPPLAFYGLDMLMRMLRYRIKDATLVPVDENMTIIHVNDCDGGWQAGQHVRLRVFFSNRIFESHPLTILSAPPSTSCLSTRSLILGARVSGDWTRALNNYTQTELSRLVLDNEKSEPTGAPVQVMVDGPYGGCSVDLGRYESVLLVAGGSGATFTIGLLDDIVGRCVKLGRKCGEKTRRIEFAWCVRSFGCIEWFAPMLLAIANTAAGSSLDLHISVYVTCLCNPEAVPAIPNSCVSIERPSVRKLLQDLVTPPGATIEEEESADKISLDGKLNWVGLGGGVAVCASGPEAMTREAQNAVARVGLTRGVELGGIALHTELFAL